MPKSYSVAIRFATCVATAMLLHAPVSAHSLVATYVPWGVDEYELLGLTEPELTKKFKGTLEFEDHFTKAFFAGYNHSGFGRPQFKLTLENGKVVSVKRLFIDGAGCNILGPSFTSKKEALRFSIDGLSKLTNRSAEDEAKLKAAKQMLIEIESPKSKSNSN